MLSDNHAFYRLQQKHKFLLLPIEEKEENAHLRIIHRLHPDLILTRLRQIHIPTPDLFKQLFPRPIPHLPNLLLRILRTIIRIRQKITILIVPKRVRLTLSRQSPLMQTPILRNPSIRIHVVTHHPATMPSSIRQNQRTPITMINRLPIFITRRPIQRPLHILLRIPARRLPSRNRLTNRSVRIIPGRLTIRRQTGAIPRLHKPRFRTSQARNTALRLRSSTQRRPILRNTMTTITHLTPHTTKLTPITRNTIMLLISRHMPGSVLPPTYMMTGAVVMPGDATTRLNTVIWGRNLLRRLVDATFRINLRPRLLPTTRPILNRTRILVRRGVWHFRIPRGMRTARTLFDDLLKLL